MATRKKLKVGVWEGAGPEPGYEWSVGILDIAFEEAIPVLTEHGCAHMAMQMKELAGQLDPKHSDMIDVRPIENFMEIRDHGGPFGGRNVRVFYGVDDERRAIIVLGAIDKQNNGPTPQGDKVTMRRRWRKYNEGAYGFLTA